MNIRSFGKEELSGIVSLAIGNEEGVAGLHGVIDNLMTIGGPREFHSTGRKDRGRLL